MTAKNILRNTMKQLFTFLIFNLMFVVSYAQRMDDSWKIFDDSEVARIDITIDPARLNWIYKNVHSDSLHPASMHFKNKWIDEAVDSIGFRIRGNTSRDSQKKSFKISFNDFIPGREFYGLDKMNLNGEHNDPSIIRSKLAFDLFRDAGITASRASFAEVYINSQYFGLYISVEHVDDEFLKKNYSDASGNLWKCLWPADLVYKGSNPDLYKFSSGGRRAYDLTTNKEKDDYSQLARFINILNNTPGHLLADSLEKILEVPEVLKYFAMNILVGHWDDYWSNQNNFYIYHNPSENKFHWIPYDYDNTFGISWWDINWADVSPYDFPKINDGPRPLASRLMSNNQYRSLYTHMLNFYKDNIFRMDLWELKLNSFRNMITPFAVKDTFRTKDYNFTMNDFTNSYGTNYSKLHVRKGIKQFVNERYSSLSWHLETVNSEPAVYAIDWNPKSPKPSDTIYVTVSAYDHSGLNEVSILFTPSGSADAINYPLSFSPVPQTSKIEEADRWIGTIPPLGTNGSGTFKIFVNDNDQLSLSYPRHKSIYIESSEAAALVINEFMASNVSTIADSAGEFDDWLEIYNPADTEINLTGLYLSDKRNNLTKWQFPENSFITAKGFLLIWCDEDSSQGSFHANFKLDADGEFIALTSSDGVNIIDSVSFGVQSPDFSYGRSPDGSDNWLFFNQPTPGSPNIVTAVEEEYIPTEFKLSVYPNPFNPSTKIKFTIPAHPPLLTNASKAGESRLVTLKLYDILGNEIAALINEEKSAGTHTIIFDANKIGKRLTSGVYFIKLHAGDLISAKKLMLIK